jgi:hypothetical protein
MKSVATKGLGAMLLDFLMLLLLLGLFALCAALVYFAENVIRPVGESRNGPRRDELAKDAL